MVNETRGDYLLKKIAAIECSDYEFRVQALYGGGCIITVLAERLCTEDVVIRWQRGRDWYIPEHFSDAQIYNTCLMAVLAFEEHEIREKFKVNGKALYAPAH